MCRSIVHKTMKFEKKTWKVKGERKKAERLVTNRRRLNDGFGRKPGGKH